MFDIPFFNNLSISLIGLKNKEHKFQLKIDKTTYSKS